MSQYQRLLLIADPGMRQSPALQRAVALVQACGGSLHIAAISGPYATMWLLDKSTEAQVRDDYLRQQQAYLKTEADRLSDTGIAVTTEAVWTDTPVEEILLHIKNVQADLVIKDTHHESILQRAFITPLDWQLLRECPVPLHLVSAAEHPLPRRVVAAVDLSDAKNRVSDLSERILAAANDLAVQCNAELHLLHAYEHSPAYLAYAAAPVSWPPEFLEELTSIMRKTFNEFAEQHGVPPQRRHVVEGSPIRMISDFATREHMDVVVMGTLDSKGLEKVLGSTTEQTLYQVPSSILAIRPT
ncbi:universal stress protein [Pseudomonas sp. SA3-5]|uniref:Universal stress protein n=1 Tax=Pseudomonas aestuarii TaxID=3018340 RepID=A0ABT4XDR1_9PSED|nr:universal stress protein [Pseudomonas aestuarii]MDA7086336.1 universal stress protein [Pseudomonas aestuarii]